MTTPPLFRRFVAKYINHLYLAIIILCFGIAGEMDYQDQLHYEAVYKNNKSNTATTGNLQLGQPNPAMPALAVSEQLFYSQQAEIKAIQQEDQALRDLLVKLDAKQ